MFTVNHFLVHFGLPLVKYTVKITAVNKLANKNKHKVTQ